MKKWIKQEVSEWLRCSEDPIYFIKNYVKVFNFKDGSLVPFEMTEENEDDLKELVEENRIDWQKPRQSGTTTKICSYILWQVLFNEHQNVAVVGKTYDIRYHMMTKIRDIYEALPDFLKTSIKEQNKSKLVFDNESRILLSSVDSLRGLSISTVYVDQFHHLPDRDQQHLMAGIYPTLTSKSKLFLVTTG